MYIAVDFDGTIVKHEYPRIGEELPGAFDTLKELQKTNSLILHTMRSGPELKDAVKYCEERGVTFFGVNENPTQHTWTGSPKIYAHIYIDDAALGCPLVLPAGGERPYVDWLEVRRLMSKAGEAS
jgi:hypothetical protein